MSVCMWDQARRRRSAIVVWSTSITVPWHLVMTAAE